MPRKATQKRMTIEELKVLMRSQLYWGRLVDVGVPIVKVGNSAVQSCQSQKLSSGVNEREHNNMI